MALDSEPLICCLKTCSNKNDLKDQNRVEVKSFSSPTKESFAVNWKEDGQAVFHKECWAIIQGLKYLKDGGEKEMVDEAAKTAEFHDSPDAIEDEARRIAIMLKNACHAIAFTGAGISTSAGIGDFRGKGGAWTERDRHRKYGAAAKKVNRKSFSFKSLRPTYTHEAIAKLVSTGLIKYVISQNIDGLHSLSGISASQMSEVHGNVFHEKCEQCHTHFERDFAYCDRKKTKEPKVWEKKCPTCKINHRTGAVCSQTGCDGYLTNTIINFGDELEEKVFQTAQDNACANDMVLCLGSSLKVTPACGFVEMGNPVKLAICNRQPTPYDQRSLTNGSRVYGDCDDLMQHVMKNILSEDDLKEWENNGENRLDYYESQRS